MYLQTPATGIGFCSPTRAEPSLAPFQPGLQPEGSVTDFNIVFEDGPDT